jgi:molybdate transport system substrate-binding protein
MSRRAFIPLLVAVALMTGLPAPTLAAATELRVAVAANFLGTLQRLAPLYERLTGTRVVLSAGASGQLYAQIVAGAPFDVFLSADSERPALLEKSGHAAQGSRLTYAIGTLVLWSPTPGRFTDGAAWLRSGAYRYIAVADPKAAPYGAAARQVLQQLQLWDDLQSQQKLVTGSSLSQTQQFAASGNAQASFIARSQLPRSGGRVAGSYWIPPQSSYQPILQQAVVLASSSSRAEAQRFLAWLHDDATVARELRDAGYRMPAHE